MGYRRRNRRRSGRLSVALIVVLAAVVVAGCSLRESLRPDTYTVKRGDTLSAIAASYGLDWRKLAKWNRIKPPYTIEIGQRLSLDPYPRLDYRDTLRSRRTKTPRVARAPQDTRAEQNRAIQASTPQLTRTIEQVDQPPSTAPQPDADEAAQKAPPMQPAEPAPDSREITAASRQSPSRPTRTGGPSEDGWQWPASGSILSEYAATRARKGIDIGGRENSPVYAASSGRVVYNGTGLKGYGQLVIIKHDAQYLSAYGFNKRTYVKQGQDVAAGTHIADMGLGPQSKPMLHFEIRRDGDPIDPERMLPQE